MWYQPKTLRRLSQRTFHNSRVPELGELCVPWFLRILWFYSSIGLKLVPWLRRCFLVGGILFNLCILRNPFLIGVFLIRVYCGVQGIFIRGAQVKDMLDPSRIPLTLVSFIPSITYSIYAFQSSHPCIDDLKAHSLALRWIVSFVESFTGALKLLDTTGSSPLLRLQELPLSHIYLVNFKNI